LKLKIKITSIKQLYAIFITVSLILSAIASYYILKTNLPYYFRLDEKRFTKFGTEIFFYIDLNNDGISDKIEFTYMDKPLNDHIIVFKNGTYLIDQFNTFGRSDPDWIYAEDYNGDGYKEVFMFFKATDSLFLSVIDVKAKDYILNRQFLLSKPDSAKGNFWDVYLHPYGLLKTNHTLTKKFIFTVKTGYAIYPRGVYAFDMEKRRIVNKFESGADLQDLKFYDLNNDGRTEIILSTQAPANMKKKTGIHDHVKWLIVLDDNLKPFFKPVPLGSSAGAEYSIPVKNGKTNNILVFYQQYSDSARIMNALLFNFKGEKIDSFKNFPKQLHRPIKIKEEDKEIIYTSDLDGNLYKMDTKLKILKTTKTTDNHLIFNKKVKLPSFENNFLIAGNSITKKLYLISNSLNIMAEYTFPELFVTNRNAITIKLNGKNKPPQLAVSNLKNNYLFTVKKNKIYSLLPLISMGMFLGFFTLFVAAHRVNSYLSTYITYFGHSLQRSNNGIIILNHSGKIFFMNENSKKYLDVNTDVRKKESYKSVFGNLPRLLHLTEVALKTKNKTEGDISFSTGTKEFKGDVNITPFTSFIGFTYAYLLEIRDYTQPLLGDRGKVWTSTVQRIAHEIKTPLSSIGLNLKTLQLRLNEENINGKDKYESDIMLMKTEISRIKELVNSFLKFTNLNETKKQFLNINELLYKSLKNFASYTSRGVNVEWNLDEDCKTVQGDEKQLIQLFHLIIENAIDAMNGVGKLEIASKCYKNGNVNEKYKPNGDFSTLVEIGIKDSGPGIMNDIKDRVFEPYFTTKKDGTGMGLALAKKIVEDHGGIIEIESSAETGTTVKVTLKGE